jgi:D-hydroxyproline dehydrogenase subunit beta
MSRTYDVAIVGSGIVGLGAAYAAATRGQRVIVIDRASEPMGATVRNFGHLCIGAQTGVARAYADASRPLWLQLSRDAGFWLRESGTLVVARHDDELRLLEVAARDGGIELLDADDIERRTPVRAGIAVGGAHVAPDLQTDPRAAGPAIRAHLASLGVEFLLRTSVGRVTAGLVQTSRGDIRAGLVVVAVNHDVDQLLPDLAEAVGVQRCGLDMLRARADIPALTAPLLTGWSLIRYGRFAALPEVSRLRERLHDERPDLAAIDINQMYTQLPDGSFIVGDTHAKGAGIPPFQSEAASDLMLEEFRELFGATPRVVERWQGVYATGPDEFLVAEPESDLVVLAATTGIGMTTGLGLAETTLAPRLGTRLARRADAVLHREGTLR